MFLIDSKTNKIKMTKGDDVTFKVNTYYADGTVYQYDVYDKVIFTVKNSKYSRIPLIEKEADISGYITLVPDDTKKLNPDYGYVYDIELIQAQDGLISTIVPWSLFVLDWEITE